MFKVIINSRKIGEFKDFPEAFERFFFCSEKIENKNSCWIENEFFVAYTTSNGGKRTEGLKCIANYERLISFTAGKDVANFEKNEIKKFFVSSEIERLKRFLEQLKDYKKE